MSLTHEEYPALLEQLPPAQAIAVLDERMQNISAVNNEIIEWLAERRRVEAAYVQGLRRLSRPKNNHAMDLGIFLAPWQNLMNSMETLAQAHHILAQRIQSDVEKPLREYQTPNRRMVAMSQSQSNLAAIAREVDNVHRKMAKMSLGKSAGQRAAHATGDLEEATLSWDSQAPQVFDQLQTLDIDRLDHLRDALTQLETHEVDRIEQSRTAAESCLNSILNVNVEEEISAFVARQTANATSLGSKIAESSSQPSLDHARSKDKDTHRAGTTASDRASSYASNPTTTPSRRQTEQDDQSSPHSNTSARAGPTKKGFGGLRRLGTVLGGGRDKSHPKGSEMQQASLDKKHRRNPLRRGHSSRQDMQQLDSPPQSPIVPLSSQNPNSNQDQDQNPSSPSDIPSKAPQLDDNLSPSVTNRSIPRPSSGPRIAEMNEVNTPPLPPPSRLSRLSEQHAPKPIRKDDPMLDSGSASTSSVNRQPNSGPAPASESDERQMNENEQSSFANAEDDITRAQREASALGDETSQLKLDIRQVPIAEEDLSAQQTAFSSVANTLRAQAPQAVMPRKPGTVRGRRDVRNTIFVPSGLTESSGSSGTFAAPLSSANLPSSSSYNLSSRHSMLPSSISMASSMTSNSSLGPGNLPNATNPYITPSMSSVMSNVSSKPSSSTTDTQKQAVELDHGYESSHADPRTQSSPDTLGLGEPRSQDQLQSQATRQNPIQSSQSTSVGSSGLTSHPKMSAQGLNASIIETVHATFENGSVTRCVMVGEIAIQYNSIPDNTSDSAADPTSATIRLDRFSILDKVAPNPSFVTALPANVPDGMAVPGGYKIDLKSCIDNPKIGFKYQVYIDETSRAQHAPIKLHPTWKIENNQASVIVQYSLSAGFSRLSLSNVVVSVSLSESGDGVSDNTTEAKQDSGQSKSSLAIACQSKPQGIFSKEKSKIYWRLGDLVLNEDKAAQPQRLLARFTTTQTVRPGDAEMRWEMSGLDSDKYGSGLGISRGELSRSATGKGVLEKSDLHITSSTDDSALASAATTASTTTDPFADEGTTRDHLDASGIKNNDDSQWSSLPLHRHIVSGRYFAAS